MASKEASGYDLHWVEDPPDDLKCQICLCVARDPRQHPGDDHNPCGKIFCLECITKHQRRKTTCPNCRQNLILFSDTRSARNIKALRIKCDNETNGCEWTGELGSLETHLQSCDYALVPCPNQCKTDIEVTNLLRKSLNNHLANDCPRRQYKCPHCQETGEHQERTTTHLDTCPRVERHCPNADCQDMIPRCDIETHRSTCAYESVSCKYAAVGCEEKPLRKDLTEHEKDSLLHLQVTTEKVLELTQLLQRVTALEDKYSVTPPCTVRLTNYQPPTQRNSNYFYTRPFYTSSKGYKMCLGVNNLKEDTCIIVKVYLMKGDHDDTLTWPFTGTVTIELLNQLQDKQHLKQTITISGSTRVVNDKRQNGWGNNLHILASTLKYDATTTTQYLKDDTLVFRVSVKVPNHKPWLESTN